MSVKPEWKRLGNEDEWAYIYRICSQRPLIGTWKEVGDIINEELGRSSPDSTYRYAYECYHKIAASLQSRLQALSLEAEDLVNLKHKTEDLIIQMRDERMALNREKRDRARANKTLELMKDNLSTIGRVEFPIVCNSENENITSDYQMLICVSDIHAGACDKEELTEFFESYLEAIDDERTRYDCKQATVCLLGDLISGNIHKSLAITNKENVISQIKTAAELITSFVYEITLRFDKVTMYDVSGNHSRVDRKEDALNDERLDSLIPYMVESSLQHNDNFKYVKSGVFQNSQDKEYSTIKSFTIGNRIYVAVHGDYDKFTKESVAKLTMYLGRKPYAVLFGHEHEPGYDSAWNVKMIRSGSMQHGGTDEYTERMRLCGNPSQTICILNENGEIKSFIPVEQK